jgi:hypothetical protein
MGSSHRFVQPHTNTEWAEWLVTLPTIGVRDWSQRNAVQLPLGYAYSAGRFRFTGMISSFLFPTLGIRVGTWICLHYTRTLTITCKYPSSPSSPSLRKVHNLIWSESPDITIRHSSFNFHYLLVSLDLSSPASLTSSSSCLNLLPRLLSLYHSFYLSFNNLL